MKHHAPWRPLKMVAGKTPQATISTTFFSRVKQAHDENSEQEEHRRADSEFFLTCSDPSSVQSERNRGLNLAPVYRDDQDRSFFKMPCEYSRFEFEAFR